jgi:hypothetical protein
MCLPSSCHATSHPEMHLEAVLFNILIAHYVTLVGPKILYHLMAGLKKQKVGNRRTRRNSTRLIKEIRKAYVLTNI